jgi:hypothetical protein
VITLSEVTRGIYGAWRLALGQRDGLAWFDASPTGALRSFFAALIAFPIATILLAFDLARFEVAASAPQIALVYTLAYALDWAAFPLVVHGLGPSLGYEAHFLRYIPALNWSRVMELAVLLPGGIILGTGISGPLLIIPALLFAAVVLYHWYVAKVALDISNGKAASLVAINIFIGVMISLWAQNLIR